MVSGIAFSIAFLCLFEASLFKKDFFSPARVYIFTQSLTLGIAYLKLSSKMTDFYILTWVVFLGGALSFVIGCYTMKLVFNAKALNSNSHKRFDSFKDYKWSFHCLFAFILFLPYFLPAKRLFDYAGGFPLFSPQLSEIMSQRLDSIIGWLFYPLVFSPLVIILFGVASFSSINPHKYLRYFSIFMIILQFIAILLFHPARNTVFVSIASLIILWNYLRKPISGRILIFGIAILLGAFVAIAYARDQYGSGSIENFALDKVIQLPYIYIANNFWNLDYALNPQIPSAGHPPTYGLDHFIAPIPFLGSSLRKAFGWDNVFNTSVSKQHGYNTLNYLWDIYKDFGGIGIAFVPFFWGILITWLYMRLKINLQMRFLLFYSFAIIMVGLWWFSIWYKVNPVYEFWVLAVLGITELCQKKMSFKNEQ